MLDNPVSEKRRSRRYELRLPVEIFQIGGQPVSVSLQTVNISSRGALIADPDEKLRRGQSVEYRIYLPTASEGAKVYVHCLGAVVRRDATRKAAAVTLQRYEFVRASAQAAAG
ncbi:MAG: PilZ domain-containing protein [Bryobacteraceae bacterium]